MRIFWLWILFTLLAFGIFYFGVFVGQHSRLVNDTVPAVLNYQGGQQDVWTKLHHIQARWI